MPSMVTATKALPATEPERAQPLSAIEPERIRRLTRTEYGQMIGLGMFHGERVELIRGVLVKTMAPQNAPRASTVRQLYELLMTRLRGRFTLLVQLPLALSADTEPEPDVAVVPLGSYEVEHPTTALLVVEVSDSTVRTDRRKAAIYASANVPEYWIVDLGARTLEIYSSPDGERYGEVRTLRDGETAHPTQLGDVAIAVAEILPKA
jgi:Uma2 family endonuclease